MDKNGNVFTKSRIDGGELREMFSCVVELFERNAKSINDLNVFPVPDGDTGTNMLMTLRDAVGEASGRPVSSAGEVAAVIYQGAFKGGRGNSGVILAEILKGIATGFEGHADVGVNELADALQKAKEYAYKAVGQPVEGTILTVMTYAASAAMECASSGKDVLETAEAISESARTAVALTPSMLPALRQAGVVDAGGHGLAVIFEGIRLFLSGEDMPDVEYAPPEFDDSMETSGEVSMQLIDATEHEMYGYCTQFMVTGENLDVDEVRDSLSTMGKSTVVVGGGEMVKVHLHAEDPGPPISFGASLGTLSQVKIESMDDQHVEFVSARRGEVRSDQSSASMGRVSVIAVASGKGLERIFIDELGAESVLSGGDTMNPSVKQILDIVEGSTSEDVIFLPNNRNIVMAAQNAVKSSSKNLKIVQSKTIPQGISAMLEFNPEYSIDEIAFRMEDALSNIKTGEVVNAVRRVNLNGVDVQEGQVIGLMERELLVAGDSPSEVLISLLIEAEVSGENLVTIYWGGELTEGDAESVRENVERAFPDAEIDMVYGGQPFYHFIVSIE